MKNKLDELMAEIRGLEKRVGEELNRKEKEFSYIINEKKKVIFNEEVLERQRRQARSLFLYLWESPFLFVLTSPVIYSMVIPALLLDFCAWLYQGSCFPVYGLKKVKRSDFIVLDRHQLKYLNLIERLNCFYCGYFNGVIGYVREIGARTEEYWCPIKHAGRFAGRHGRYHKFMDYGDMESYAARLEEIRERARKII